MVLNFQYHCWGFPCSSCFPVHACRRHYPGRNDRPCSLVLFHRYQLCPKTQRVSFCIGRFEACSTFTHIATCMLTEPLKRPFASKAPAALLPPPPLRLLPGGTNQFPGGSTSHWKAPAFTAHAFSGVTLLLVRKTFVMNSVRLAPSGQKQMRNCFVLRNSFRSIGPPFERGPVLDRDCRCSHACWRQKPGQAPWGESISSF